LEDSTCCIVELKFFRALSHCRLTGSLKRNNTLLPFTSGVKRTLERESQLKIRRAPSSVVCVLTEPDSLYSSEKAGHVIPNTRNTTITYNESHVRIMRAEYSDLHNAASSKC
jgi:hypothetical protein